MSTLRSLVVWLVLTTYTSITICALGVTPMFTDCSNINSNFVTLRVEISSIIATGDLTKCSDDEIAKSHIQPATLNEYVNRHLAKFVPGLKALYELAYTGVVFKSILSFALLPYHHWGYVMSGITRALHFFHFPIYDSQIIGSTLGNASSHHGANSYVTTFTIVTVFVSVMILTLVAMFRNIRTDDREIERKVLSTHFSGLFVQNWVYLISSVAMIPLLQNALSLAFCYYGDTTAGHSTLFRTTSLTGVGWTSTLRRATLDGLSATASDLFRTFEEGGRELYAPTPGIVVNKTLSLLFPPTLWVLNGSMANVATSPAAYTAASSGISFNHMTIAQPAHLLWFPSHGCGVNNLETFTGFGLAICIIGFFAVFPLAFFMNTVVFDVIPTSAHLLARAHSSFDALYMVFKLVACVLMHYFLSLGTQQSTSLLFKGSSSHTSPTGLGYYNQPLSTEDGTEIPSVLMYYAIFMAFASFSLMIVALLTLPYYKNFVNKVRVTSLFVCCVGSIFSAITHNPSVRHFFRGEKQLKEMFTTAFMASSALVRTGSQPGSTLLRTTFTNTQRIFFSNTSAMATVPLNPKTGQAYYVTYFRDNSTQLHIDVLVFIVVGIAATYIGSQYLTLWRVSSLFRKGITELKDGYVRSRTSHFPRRLPAGEDIFEDFDEIVKDIASTEVLQEVRINAALSTGADYHDDRGMYHFTMPYVDDILFSSDVELSTRFLAAYREITNSRPFTGFMLAYAAKIFCKGIVKYRSTARVRLAFANFLGCYASKGRTALFQLQLLRNKESSISERYHAWRLYSRLANALHVNESVSLEAYTRAKRRHRDAMQYFSDFWQILRSDEVDKVALSEVSRAVQHAKKEVGEVYILLLTKFTGNMDLVSTFAQYCETMLLNVDATAQTLQCLRELRETKKLNAVRGARILLAEKETLTHLPMEIVDEEEDTQDNESTESIFVARRILWLTAAAVILFLIGFIVVGEVYEGKRSTAIDTMVRCGELRSLAAECVVASQNLVAAAKLQATEEGTASVLTGTSAAINVATGGLDGDGGGSASSRLASADDTALTETEIAVINAKAELLTLHDDFRALHNALLFTDLRPRLSKHKDFVRQLKFIPLGADTINYWSMGYMASMAMKDLIVNPLGELNSTSQQFPPSYDATWAAVQSAEAIPTSKQLDFIKQEFPQTVTFAVNRTMEYYSETVIALENECMAIQLFFIASVIALSGLGMLLLFYFNHKIEGIRTDIFSLFTLIPKRVCRKLHKESRRKLTELEQFFSLPTRGKVVYLIGADDEGVQPDLVGTQKNSNNRTTSGQKDDSSDDSDDGVNNKAVAARRRSVDNNAKNDSDEDGHYVHANQIDKSESRSADSRAAISSNSTANPNAASRTSGPSTSGSVRAFAHQTRLDEINSTNMLQAKANRVVLSDAIFHGPTLVGWVLMVATLGIVVALLAVGLTELNNGVNKAYLERPLQAAVKQQNFVMTQLISVARGFIMTGERSYFNSYVLAMADERDVNVRQYMMALDATTEEMEVFNEFTESLEATKEVLKLSIRMALSTYPIPGVPVTVANASSPFGNQTYTATYRTLYPLSDTAGNIKAGVAYTSMANASWPQEEGLLYIEVARRLNLIEFRKGLVDGSPIDLLKPPAVQVEIARQMVYSYTFFAIKSDMEKKVQYLQTLGAVETNRRRSLTSFIAYSYVSAGLCLIPLLLIGFIFQRAYRIGSFRILKHPLTVGATALTTILIMCCAGFAIAPPLIVDSVNRISTAFEALHSREAEWNRHLEATINYPRHFLGSRSMLWLYMFRDSLGQDPLAAAQQPVYGIDPYTIIQGTSNDILLESQGINWQRSGAGSSFTVPEENDVNFVYLFNNYAYDIAGVGSQNDNNKNGVPLATDDIAAKHHHPITEAYAIDNIDSATEEAKRRIGDRVKKLQEDIREYKHVCRVSIALAYSAYENRTMFPINPRQEIGLAVSDVTFIATIDWDFPTEDHYARTYAKYYLDTPLFYSNRTHDLSLPSADKLRLATCTLFGKRAMDLISTMRSSIEEVFGWLDNAAVQTRRARWYFASRILIVAIVMASVVLALVISMGIVAFIIYTKHSSSSLQRTGKAPGGSAEQTNSQPAPKGTTPNGDKHPSNGEEPTRAPSTVTVGRLAPSTSTAETSAAARAAHSFQIHNTSAYSSLVHSTTCPMMSFSLIIIVAFLLLACVILRRDMAMQAPTTINLATERSWLVARTMARSMSMGSDRPTFYRSQAFLNRISKLMESNTPKLYFKGGNHYFGALTDETQDKILFARSNYYVLAREISDTATSYRSIMSNKYVCNLTKGAKYLERISAGVGLAYSDTWLKLVKALAVATPSTLTTLLVQLDYHYKALMLGLTVSTARYEERIKAQQTLWHNVILIISVILIAYVILHNLVIVEQYIGFLRSEEASARLMLRMIPQEAKDSNPQIIAFLESGKLSSNGGAFDGLASEANASMSALPVIAIDQQGIIIRFSVAAENVFGYQAQEVIGRNVGMLMPPEYAASHDAYLASYRRTGVRHVIGNINRFKGVKKDGKVFPFELTVKEVKVSEDESYYIGVGKDLSTRMELDLQIRLNKYLLDLTSDCVVMIDHQGTIRLASKAAQHIFGYTPEDLLGENCKLLMTPLDAQDHDGYLRRYRETGVKHIIDTTRDVQGQCKNGEVLTIALSVREITDVVRGEPSSFIAFIRDASDRLILSSQMHTNSVISSLSPVPVMALTRSGVFVKFSAAAEKLFGYSSDELVRCGMNFRALLDLSNKANEEIIREYLGLIPETRGVVGRSTNIVALKKSGEKVPVRLSVHEVANESMEPIFVLYATDITQVQNAEGQVQLLRVMREWSVVPIVGTNSAGIITSFNASACTAFKYQPDEVIGRNCNILMPAGKRERHVAAMAAHAQKSDAERHRVADRVRHETALRSDGSTFPVKITLREVKDPQTLRVEHFAFIEDMTEARSTSQKLIVNEAFLSMSPVPIISINGEGRIELFSAAAEQCFGYSAVEVIGENITIIMPPEIRPKHDSFLSLFHKTGNKTAIDQTLSVTAVRRNGSRFPVEVSVREVRKYEISALGALGTSSTTGDRLKKRSASPLSNEKASFVAYVKEMSAEGQLLEAKALGATIAALSPIPIIQSTVRGVITYVNPAACREFRFEAREMVGRNVKMLMETSIGEKHEKYLKNYETRRIRERKQIENLRGIATGGGGVTNGSRGTAAEEGSTDSGAINTGPHAMRVTGGRFTRTWGSGHNGHNHSLSTKAPSSKESGPHSPIARGSGVPSTFGHHFWRDVGEHAWNQIQSNYMTVRSQAKRRDGSRFDVEIKISEVPRLREEDGLLLKIENNNNNNDVGSSGSGGSNSSQTNTTPRATSSAHHKRGTVMTPLGGNDSDVVNNPYEQSSSISERPGKGIGVPPLANSPGGTRPKSQIPQQDASSYHPTTMTGSDLNGTVELLAYIRNLDLQRKLEQANENIDVIVNMSIVPVVAIDSQRVVIIFSSAAEQAFGYRSSEVLGNNVRLLMPPEISVKHDSYIRTYFKTGIKTVIGNVLRQEGMRKDGSRFPLELSVKEIIKPGHRTLFIAYLRPVAHDTALEQATQLSQTIIAQSPIPVIVINLKGIIRTFNNAAVALTGFSQEEAVGVNVGLIMENDEAKYHDKYLKMYSQTGIKTAIDAATQRKVRTKGGQLIEASVTVKEVVRSSGEVLYIGFVRDLTRELDLQSTTVVNDVVASLSPTPLICINERGTVIKFNAAAERDFRYSAHEVLGQNVNILMTEDISKKHDGFLARFTARKNQYAAQQQQLQHQSQLGAHGTNNSGNLNRHTSASDGARRASAPLNNDYPQQGCPAGQQPIPSLPPLELQLHEYGRRRTGEHFPIEITIKEIRGVNSWVAGQNGRGIDLDGYLSGNTAGGGSSGGSVFVAFIRDLTSRYEAEHYKSLYETVVDISPVPIISIQPDGAIIDFNRAAVQVFKFEFEEVFRCNVRMLMPKEVADKHDMYLKRYLETGVKTIIDQTREVYAKRKSGPKFPAKLLIREIKDEDRHYFIANLTDISLTTALEHAWNINDCIVDMSDTAIACTDSKGIITKFSRVACEVFKCGEREMLGKDLGNLMTEGWRSQWNSSFVAWFNHQTAIAQLAGGAPHNNNSGSGNVSANYTNRNNSFASNATYDHSYGIGSSATLQSIFNKDKTAAKHVISPNFSPAFAANIAATASAANNNKAQISASSNQNNNAARTLSQTLRCRRTDGTEFTALISVNEIPKDEKDINDPLCVMTAGSHQKAQALSAKANGGFVVSISNYTEQAMGAEEDAVLAATEELAQNALIVVDGEGTIVRLNNSCAYLFGYPTKAALLGKNVKMLMPPGAGEAHDAAMARYLGTGRSHVLGTPRAVLAKTRNGQHIQAELTAIRICTGSNNLDEGASSQPTKNGFLPHGTTSNNNASDTSGDTKATYATNQPHNNSTTLNTSGSPINSTGSGAAAIAPTADNSYASDRYGFGGARQREDPKTVLFLGVIENLHQKEALSYAPLLGSLALQISHTPLVITDKHGIILDINPATERVFDFTKSQAVGKNVGILMPMGFQKQHDRFLEKYLATGEKHAIDSTISGTGETRTGSPILLKISIKEFRRDKELRFIGALTPLLEPITSSVSATTSGDHTNVSSHMASGNHHPSNNGNKKSSNPLQAKHFHHPQQQSNLNISIIPQQVSVPFQLQHQLDMRPLQPTYSDPHNSSSSRTIQMSNTTAPPMPPGSIGSIVGFNHDQTAGPQGTILQRQASCSSRLDPFTEPSLGDTGSGGQLFQGGTGTAPQRPNTMPPRR